MAEEVTPQLVEQERRLVQLLSGTSWLGKRKAENFHDEIVRLVTNSSHELVRNHLGKEATQALSQLSPLVDKTRFETEREIANARYIARKKEPALLDLMKDSQSLFEGSRYVRHSMAKAFQTRIKLVLRQVGGRFVIGNLSPQALSAVHSLETLLSEDQLETERARANSRFISAERASVRRAANDTASKPLTDEQLDAVATDEEVTLVLAGAGTGKTAVITSKVAYLVRSLGVSPGQILVLSYNNKARAEIQDRLAPDLRGSHVHTFHSFGRKVIGEATGKKPSVSPLAEDEWKLTQIIDEILQELLRIPPFDRTLLELLALRPTAYKSPFDFTTSRDYNEFVRRSARLTLKGERVRSLEEVQVANFLHLNGVRYEYERPYPFETADAKHSQYRPDFYLPDYDIYIEHFALDENENAPKHFVDYKSGVRWKRSIHKRYGTTLIETHSSDCSTGELPENLTRFLRNHGVVLQRVPLDVLLEDLKKISWSWLASLLATFLERAKANMTTHDELILRREDLVDKYRTHDFLGVFREVRARYEQMLAKRGELDFADLINKAIEQIRDGSWNVPFRYVLVDEFQDISLDRMTLLESLKSKGIAYFLVGDDWQSINRFAGSDVSLMDACDEYLGYVRKHFLTTTFRFGKRILEPTSHFVQRNPKQSQRPLSTKAKGIDLGINVVACENPSHGIEAARKDISEQDIDFGSGSTIAANHRHEKSLLVLGRFNKSGFLVPQGLKFSTVHAAKGQEADYVLVLDLKDDDRGFPAHIEDDPLLDLFHQPAKTDSFPNAEERRLFYVATTRAKRGVYLITDLHHPSSFVRELDRDFPRTRHIGGRTDAAPDVCPRCKLGVLIRKMGSRGPFWGCSRYRAIPRCTYAKDM